MSTLAQIWLLDAQRNNFLIIEAKYKSSKNLVTNTTLEEYYDIWEER